MYVQAEVYQAMVYIVDECLRVSDMTLFSIKHGESLSLDDFEVQQLQATYEVINYLTDRWTKNISQAVKTCLEDIGKGWFDLTQKNYYIYDIMKLKRFIDVIKQRMQVNRIYKIR